MSIRRAWPAAAAIAAVLAGCDVPPPEAYVVGGRGPAAAARPVGNNTQGEPCVMQPSRPRQDDPEEARAFDIFCGQWQQPSARLLVGSSGGDLPSLATSGPWRDALEQRAACAAPRATTILSGDTALLMECTRRTGGWPHVALVARSSGGTMMADGVLPALPAIEAAAGVLSGAQVRAEAGTARSAALTLLSNRLASESFASTDIGRYEDLIRLGNELNQAESFGASENAYRAALALHERVLGAENPGGVGAAMSLALQLSNQGRMLEADALLARASRQAPQAADPLAPARLLHYRAMHAGNQRLLPQALRDIAAAEAAYSALLPPQTLSQANAAAGGRTLLVDTSTQHALAGYAEARRYHAVLLRRNGQTEEAERMAREVRDLVRAFAPDSAVLAGRAARTAGEAAARGGDQANAASLFNESARLLARALPNERPVALAQFQAGSALAQSGRREEALVAFREGARILRERRLGLSEAAVMPYLDALADAAETARDPAPLAAEMFEAAQLIRGGITARLIAQAAARLGAAEGSSGASAAIRRLQEAEARLDALYARRDSAADAAATAVTEQADPRVIAQLDREIAAAQALRAEAESEVQAAAPGYRQLVLGATTAEEARAHLAPAEALAVIVPGTAGGHTLLLRREGITAGRVRLPEEDITALVLRIRASAELQFDGPGGAARLAPFDAASAYALYRAVLGDVAQSLTGAERIVVVPSGALLSLPFGLLPTAAPAQGQPPQWLLASMAVTHVPSVQSFVSLRRAAAPSRARSAYLGFGDFVPPTAAQVAQSFPPARCAADAQAVRGLSALPGTRAEVEAARRLLGAPASDVVTGAAFVPAAVRGRELADYRIVHFAAHAVLPSEIACLAEPAILASTPPNGGASAAFITATDILGLSMDADLAILSACNSGGPGGGVAGESLSGLARSFFYAGARGLMVTHWAVDDTASALLVADTLRRLSSGTPRAAEALRAAQLAMIADAGAGRLPDVFAHPFFWAPFALIGDGPQTTPQLQAARQ